MADGFIEVPPDSTGKKVDASELTVGANLVERQRIILADPTAAGNFAGVTAAGELTVTGAVTGPLTDTQIRATPVPVSGTVTASGPLTDTQLRATAVPVSGTITTTPPSNASTNVAQVAGTAASVNSGTKDAGTLRVVLATDQPALTNKLLVTPDSVALPANQSVNVAQMGGIATSMNTGVRDTGTQRVTVATNDLVPVSGTVTVTPPTLTKGTQGATGFSTQDLKDSGRVRLSFYANGVAAGATGVETLITLSKSADQAAVTTAGSFVVTSGKRFRIESITVGSRGNATAVAQITTFNLRINTAGAVIASSTPLILAGATATPATSLAWDRLSIPIPDGFEILGDGTLQFGISANAVFVTSAPTWFVNIIGYEY